MGGLAGVADVKFDCKIATVTMKPGATLASDAAEKALVGVGLGMSSFAGGPPATALVLRARVAPIPGATASPDPSIETLASSLTRELPAISEVLVETNGRITVRVKPDAKLEASELAAAISRLAHVVSEVERKEWPRTAAGYVVALGAATDGAKRASARAAIEKVDVVLAALERKDGTLIVFTKEPCGNLEQRLRDALAPAGAELASVKPRA